MYVQLLPQPTLNSTNLGSNFQVQLLTDAEFIPQLEFHLLKDRFTVTVHTHTHKNITLNQNQNQSDHYFYKRDLLTNKHFAPCCV